MIEPYQRIPVWVRVDLWAMAEKGYGAFPKAPALLEPHHQIVESHIQDMRWGVLFLCKDTVGVFYNHSRLGNIFLNWPKFIWLHK